MIKIIIILIIGAVIFYLVKNWKSKATPEFWAKWNPINDKLQSEDDYSKLRKKYENPLPSISNKGTQKEKIQLIFLIGIHFRISINTFLIK